MWKFLFSKVTGWKTANLLKMSLFVKLFQGLRLKVLPGDF